MNDQADYFLVDTGDDLLNHDLQTVVHAVGFLRSVLLDGLAWRLRRVIATGTWDGIEETKLEVLSAFIVGLRAWRSAAIEHLGLPNVKDRAAREVQRKITVAQLAAKYPEPEPEPKVVPVATWKAIQGLSTPKAIEKINQVIAGDLHLTNIFREEVTDNDRLETGA